MMSPNGALFYQHGMFGSYCIQCCMGVPHFICFSTYPPDFDATKEILKKMTDKLEQHSNNNPQTQWPPFQPSFGGRASEPHPFSYEQQHREVDRPPPGGDFNNDSSRQQPPQLMPHFFPRIGLPFPDFTDYQRFNGFQRNFFPNQFTPQFLNPTYPFPMNPAMQNTMTNMDNFNIPNGIPQQFNQNPNPNTNSNALKPKEGLIQNGTSLHNPVETKPPILSAEHFLKHEDKLQFNMNSTFIPKNETTEDLSRKMNGTKKEPNFNFPPAPSGEKPFESSRPRDDVVNFNSQFYPTQQLGMETTNTFKQEMNTPPGALHDCQVCLSTHANGLHFGARTCAACAAFFRRTISDDKRYVCKRNQRCTNASRDGTGYRKICRSCRMKRCLEIGMLPENVQHKRNRRESTSPHQKPQLDTFFNGFYPAFSSSHTTTVSADTTQPADPCHKSS